MKEIKRVIDLMGWKEVTLIGHSLGAIYSFLFAAVFPELVKRLVSIDIPKPSTSIGDNWISRVPRVIEKQLEYDHYYMDDPTLNKSARIYNWDDAVKKMMEGHGNSLTEESSKILMTRGAKQLRGGWTYTRCGIQFLNPV